MPEAFLRWWRRTEPPLAQAAASAPSGWWRRFHSAEVKGRIDHMAVAVSGQRLFVAERAMGNRGGMGVSAHTLRGKGGKR